MLTFLGGSFLTNIKSLRTTLILGGGKEFSDKNLFTFISKSLGQEDPSDTGISHFKRK